MNLNASRCRAVLDSLLTESGAAIWGVAEAGEVEPGQQSAYSRWLAEDLNGPMGYMADHQPLRSHPAGLLPGVRSVISIAFAYPSAPPRPTGSLRWASYALGDDYHDVIRHRLRPVAAALSEQFGCDCRICVDTAPIPERYWAVKAGLGFTGRNAQLIIPGLGSRFFLAEILTTLPLAPDPPCRLTCDGCDACLRACPGQAIRHDGLIDARRCNSCLTIESRDPIPSGTDLRGYIYGCDICQNVCPHNAHQTPTLPPISEFSPRPSILDLTADDILTMNQTGFSSIFRNSAIKRTKLAGLLRNVKFLLNLP